MNTLATISGHAVLNTVLWIIGIGLVFWLLSWLITYCGIPEPFNKVARVVLAVAAVLFLINVLLSLAGHPIVSW